MSKSSQEEMLSFMVLLLFEQIVAVKRELQGRLNSTFKHIHTWIVGRENILMPNYSYEERGSSSTFKSRLQTEYLKGMNPLKFSAQIEVSGTSLSARITPSSTQNT